jgi:hypothetical protein
MSTLPIQFADGIVDASVHHGVVRITLGRVAEDGKPAPVGHLMVPLVQLPGMSNSLVALLRQIEARIKEAQAQNTANGATAPEGPAPDSIPGSFTFGGR